MNTKTEELPVEVKITIIYSDGTKKEIIYDFYLILYYGSWYVTDGSREDGQQNIFNFDSKNGNTTQKPNNSINLSIGIGDTLVAGSVNTYGLMPDGTVIAVGDNSSGQRNVSDWQNIVAISSGSTRIMGLKSDGSVRNSSGR